MLISFQEELLTRELTALKDMKTNTVLPPLVIDATAQTDRLTQKTESCQTKKSEGIDFGVQAEFKTDTITTGTQTIKPKNQEIAMPNRPTSGSSKPNKKRKLSAIQSPPTNPIGNTTDDSPQMGESEDANLITGTKKRNLGFKRLDGEDEDDDDEDEIQSTGHQSQGLPRSPVRRIHKKHDVRVTSQQTSKTPSQSDENDSLLTDCSSPLREKCESFRKIAELQTGLLSKQFFTPAVKQILLKIEELLQGITPKIRLNIYSYLVKVCFNLRSYVLLNFDLTKNFSFSICHLLAKHLSKRSKR